MDEARITAIDHNRYLQLLGLTTLAQGYAEKIKDCHRSMCELMMIDPSLGRPSDGETDQARQLRFGLYDMAWGGVDLDSTLKGAGIEVMPPEPPQPPESGEREP